MFFINIIPYMVYFHYLLDSALATPIFLKKVAFPALNADIQQVMRHFPALNPTLNPTLLPTLLSEQGG